MLLFLIHTCDGCKGFPGGSVVKNLPVKAGDVKRHGRIFGLGSPVAKSRGLALMAYLEALGRNSPS